MATEFISVAEAKDLIGQHTEALKSLPMPLNEAYGRTLAKDAFSKTDFPPFNQSSMDGYAFNYEGWKKFGDLQITGEVAAGSGDLKQINPENAVRIFTGAAVPDGADTVVMQEKVRVESGKLIIEDLHLVSGLYYRPKGIEIKLNELALEKGSTLTPAAVGFLAGVGISNIDVYPNPTVCIILTGNELKAPELTLDYGEVYEANSFALNAALKTAGISEVTTLSCEDNLHVLIDTLSTAIDQHDVVLLTGGVSVGDYDFVLRAAEANGVEQIFHKIRQKPGKPLYFGKKNEKVIFGLPGNPASVLSCFYQYVLPALGKMSMRDLTLKTLSVPLKMALKKPAGLTQFLKANFDGNKVSDLKAQESFRLSSFAKANCLIELPADITEFNEGEIVQIHLLPS